MKPQLFKVLVLVLGLVLLGAVPEAYACSSPPTTPSITVELHEICVPLDDPTDCMIRAWITVHNYSTFGSSTSSGGFCACAFNKIGGIKSVEWASLVDPATGERYPAWTFDSNSGVTQDAAQYLNTVASNVDGYLAKTCEDVPANTTLDLMFEVLLEKGTTIAQVSSALSSGGPAIVTGGASSGGVFLDHVETFPKKTTCQVQSTSVAYIGEAVQTLTDRGLGDSIAPKLISCKRAIAFPHLVLANSAVVSAGPQAQQIQPR